MKTIPAGLRQMDLERDTPEREVERWRAAAQAARVDIHYSAAERLKRAAYYEQRADEIERANRSTAA